MKEGAIMVFAEFVQKALAQDNRNHFGTYDGSLNEVPKSMVPLYREYNPLDVEINSDQFGTIRFIPADELSEARAEFSFIQGAFIFARSNGDPIFLYKEKVYVCPHGVTAPQWELLADELEQFFSAIL